MNVGTLCFLPRGREVSLGDRDAGLGQRDRGRRAGAGGLAGFRLAAGALGFLLARDILRPYIK